MRTPVSFQVQFNGCSSPVFGVLAGRMRRNTRSGTSPNRRQYADVRYPVRHTDWSQIERIEHKGESGLAFWRTQQFGNMRVRMVEYTPGYIADHWCVKGHILMCCEGELHTELKDGRKFTLKPGMSYQVSDNAEPHRSSTEIGAKLFIVD